jgi:serine/threonine protein phosphatase PrpC
MAFFMCMGKTHVGRTHAENQDRILIRRLKNPNRGPMIHLVGVVDGVGGTTCGGSVARWLAEHHLVTDPIFEETGKDVFDQLHVYLLGLREQFRSEFALRPDMLGSAAAMSVAGLCGDRGVCFWVGDCPAFLTSKHGPKMATVQLTHPDYDRRLQGLTDWFGAFAPYNLKCREFHMSPGDILTLTSDGAQCDEHVLSDLYRRHPFTPDTLQQIVTAALQHPRSDDVSIVASQKT